MNNEIHISATDNGPVEAALVDYFARIDRGEKVELAQLIAAHPDCEAGLRKFFRQEEKMLAVAAASPSSKVHEIQAGRMLGDFRLLHELGRGGMGVVYEAEQISLGRRIALKVLPFAAMLDKQQLARFKNEARAAATLDHPHIVTVHSVGSEGDVHYYAMQLIEGQSLAQVIATMRRVKDMSTRMSPDVDQLVTGSFTSATRSVESGNLDSDTYVSNELASRELRPAVPVATLPDFDSSEYYRTAARLGYAAAEALQHAHEMGVLHRDIKPGNLMLDPDGMLYVTDFGLARIEADAGITMTGDIVGTLRYMAPEQALAKQLVVDHRADVYALGATLYELLTLQPAFPGTDRSELLRRIACDEPPPPHKLNGRIPTELETIVIKAMAKSPDERYESARLLADDFHAFLECRPIRAKPPTLWNRTFKWSRRHRGLLTAASILFVVVAFGSLTSTTLLFWERQRTEQSATESRAVVSFLVNDLLAAAKDESILRREVTVSEVLSNAEEKLTASLADQPLVEAAVRNAVAKTYHALGKDDKAERQARRAVDLQTEFLGVTDYNTVESTRTLASVLVSLGKLDAARLLAERALECNRNEFGSGHKNTLLCSNCLASVLREQGSFEASHRLYQDVLNYKVRSIGADAAESIEARHDVARALFHLDRFDEALRLFDEIIELKRQASNRNDSPLELNAKHFRAKVLLYLGKPQNARVAFVENLAAESRLLPPGDPQTLDTIYHLAIVEDRQGDVREAIKHIDDGLKLARPNDWKVLSQFSWLLATANSRQLRDGERALFLAKNSCEITNYQAASALDSLAAAYAEVGDFESAVKWCQRALELTNDPGRRDRYSKHMESFQNRKPVWGNSKYL